MAENIGKWLEQLGLGKYAPAFLDNEIDLDTLAYVTDEALEKIGVALGARLKILAAIAAQSPEHLIRDIETKHQPESTSRARNAERRQLTVMFCDLVGSTAMSGSMDPEELRAVILAFQNAVVGEATRFEGHVARFMGDGVLLYFGWPRAHEDDAERAVRSALSMMQALSDLKVPGGENLAARIGIATGLVVVGDLIGEGASQEEAVVGETPNLAARLQSLKYLEHSISLTQKLQHPPSQAFALFQASFHYDHLMRNDVKALGHANERFLTLAEEGGF
jgi:class 3 adenylate cyclase